MFTFQVFKFIMSGTETVRKLLNSIINKIGYSDAKIEIKQVNSGGANYSSELYEITVVAKHKETLHLFAKVGIISDNMRRDVGSKLFEREDLFYRKIAKAYDEIQDKHGIPKNERYIFSKFYGSSLEVGKETFIFDNLDFKGYQIYDRFEPLDYQCMFDTTTALAKFHALGFGLLKEQPELYDQIESEEFIAMFNKFVDTACNVVPKNIKTLDEQYHERLQKYVDNGGYNKYKQLFSYKGNFVIHGDYRHSNIMYKRENDKVVVVPVDYQGVHFGSPLTDLLYFIATGTDEAFRVKHFDELVEHYYTQLSLYLSKLDIDVNEVYPKQMYQDELKELLPGTIVLALAMFPLMFVDASKAPSVSDDKMEMSGFYVVPSAKSNERLIGYVKDCIRWRII